MRNCLSLVLTLFIQPPLFSQSNDTRPAFEVAAIRRCIGTEPRATMSASPGRLSVPCFGVMRLIQEAYLIFAGGKADFMLQPPSALPIEGFPDRMSSDRYSIDAKAGSPYSIAMMRGPMMQRLLEDRFHLRIRRESREGSVYVMTVTEGGSKLRAAAENGCNPIEAADLNAIFKVAPGDKPWCGVLTPPVKSGTHFVIDEHGISLTSFATLFKIGGLPVIDRTLLNGKFDIHLEWEFSPTQPDSAGNDGGSDSPDTSIISSFRKQLGIQLKLGKGPREVLFIDHLESPSEN